MSNDADRDEIIRLILQRCEGRLRNRTRFKVLVWHATVLFAYLLKRSMDIVISVLCLFVLSPLMLGVAMAIRLESEGPIFFHQTRIGMHGVPFRFHKFRSMRITAEKEKGKIMVQNESKDGVIFKMRADPRITKVGRFIRKYSIDELPQLLNVLEGSMSLVGPRPPLPEEVKQYTLEDRRRLDVKPGITCIWQVTGRSEIPFREQVRLDEDYIRSRGFWKDVIILLKTIPAVITGRGAY